MANRPLGERLTDTQVKRIRRRRSAGEPLGALAEEYGVATRTIRRRLAAADAARAAALEQKTRRAEQKRSRGTPENPTLTAAGDRRELLRQPPAPGARHEKRPSAASGREILSAQAAATAAAEEVERLEAAYQHAFTAIERVHQLRRQQRPWEQANKLGVAVKRPEPWHVRTAHDIELRQLNKRFIQVVNSSW